MTSLPCYVACFAAYTVHQGGGISLCCGDAVQLPVVIARDSALMQRHRSNSTGQPSMQVKAISGGHYGNAVCVVAGHN